MPGWRLLNPIQRLRLGWLPISSVKNRSLSDSTLTLTSASLSVATPGQLELEGTVLLRVLDGTGPMQGLYVRAVFMVHASFRLIHWQLGALQEDLISSTHALRCHVIPRYVSLRTAVQNTYDAGLPDGWFNVRFAVPQLQVQHHLLWRLEMKGKQAGWLKVPYPTYVFRAGRVRASL